MCVCACVCVVTGRKCDSGFQVGESRVRPFACVSLVEYHKSSKLEIDDDVLNHVFRVPLRTLIAPFNVRELLFGGRVDVMS